MEDRGRAAGSSAFGMLLRQYRIAAGLSQEALAERARMSGRGIGALERGDRRTPQRETLALLADALALDDQRRREFERAAARSVLLGRGASVRIGPWPDTTIAPLPLALGGFVGRQAELNEIGALVRAHRLVTITGAGGIGKTQTALQVAASDASVNFVGLAPVGSAELVAAAIAAAVGVQEVANHPLLQTAAAFLKNKTILLILDNCEHVVAEAASVADFLLRTCPHLRILATSREPLRAGGEHAYRLPSLDDTDATALFLDRAQATDAHFVLTDEERPVVSEICCRLGGIPLAIELAAAQVSVFSLSSLAATLDHRFGVLSGGERTASPRQQTMRATIDWSYALLTAPEQRVFERLSVFAGGCTIELAEAVCQGHDVAAADVLPLISLLVEKSMLLADLGGNQSRYLMLEPFREYAHEKLLLRGEDGVAAQRHVTAHTELAMRFAFRTLSTHSVYYGQALKEIGNWRAAVQWALTERKDVVAGQRLVAEVVCLWGGYFECRSDAERQRWIAAALALADETTPLDVLAKLKLAAAKIAMELDRPALQLASAREAISYFRTADDEPSLVLALICAGNALADLGRGTEARAILEEALNLARKLGARWYIAHILRHLAWACTVDDDFVAARTCLTESLHLIEAEDDPHELDLAAWDLAELFFAEGDPESAIHYITNAAASGRRAGGRAAAQSHIIISGYLIALDRYEEAQQYARDALVVAREVYLDVYATLARGLLASIAILKRSRLASDIAGPDDRATRLLGFVTGHLRGLGAGQYSVGNIGFARARERALETLRERMSGDTVVKLMADGANMTEPDAVELASGL